MFAAVEGHNFTIYQLYTKGIRQNLSEHISVELSVLQTTALQIIQYLRYRLSTWKFDDQFFLYQYWKIIMSNSYIFKNRLFDHFERWTSWIYKPRKLCPKVLYPQILDFELACTQGFHVSEKNCNDLLM